MSYKLAWCLFCVKVFVMLFFFYLWEVEAQQFEGEACSVKKTGGVLVSGKCSVINKCPSVYEELLAGTIPDTLCGFSENDPIVCCPIEISNTSPQRSGTTPSITTQFAEISLKPSTTERTLDDETSRQAIGDLANRKCAEYAKFVYALVEPPVLTIHRQLVNTSLCAIKTKKLIVGGTRAEPKEFPHMVAVGYNDQSGDHRILWQCGGTLVSDKFVMTAAHCTYSSEYGIAAWVQVGDSNLMRNDNDAAPQTHRVAERIRHPAYKRPSVYHDIALLKLATQVAFDAYVRPACLPTSRTIKNERVIATGWGNIQTGEQNESGDLLKVTLEIVAVESCNISILGSGAEYKLNRGIVDDWQICAGQLGKDTCQGDSGGPIAVFDPFHDCMYDVVGITSFGSQCGSKQPAVYTRVYNYISWLENTIWR